MANKSNPSAVNPSDLGSVSRGRERFEQYLATSGKTKGDVTRIEALRSVLNETRKLPEKK